MYDPLRPFLIIPDLQIPFEHPKALPFCIYLKRHYKIPDENVINIGDETDEYWGGQWKKDINGLYSARTEYEVSNQRLIPWFEAFPKMMLCESNHGNRWQRKALEAEIPEVLMRRRQEVMGAPQGWRWQKRWLIKTKHPFLAEHGDDWGGQTPHMLAAQTRGHSTIMGHFHSIAGIEHIKTGHAEDGCDDDAGIDVWGMATGSLIEFKQYAFHYGRKARKKPQLGASLVFNQGRMPIWVPLEAMP